MARRRFKARSRRAVARIKSGYRKGGISSIIMTVAGAGLYGALRGKISNAIMPISAKLPLGNISDEVLIGALAIVGKKAIGRKVPLANQFFNGALIVESARIGDAIATGSVGMGSQSSSSSPWGLG